MNLRVELYLTMENLAPGMYQKNMQMENDEAVLYVRLMTALYGCLQSVMMFYNRLVVDLESVGFELNPYDPCVANNTINGQQFTAIWHVEDLKVSQKYPKQVTKFLEWLKGIYRDILTTRGTKNYYLGMQLD